MCSFQKYRKRSGFYSSEFCRCLHFLADPVCGCDPQIFLRGSEWRICGDRELQDDICKQSVSSGSRQHTSVLRSVLPLLVVLSLIIAVLLAGQKRFTQILKSFFLLPMAIPVASVVLLWRLLFDDQGLWNHLLHMLSVRTTDWMNTGASFYVLVISYIWRNLGYDVVLWMAGLSAIPAALYEAAKVDGAGEWKCFTKITLPNLLPSLFTIVVLSVLNAFKVFREAYLVAGDYPQEKMYLLQHLFNNWYRDLSLDKMSAAAVVTGLVIFLLILGLWKAWGKGGAE